MIQVPSREKSVERTFFDVAVMLLLLIFDMGTALLVQQTVMCVVLDENGTERTLPVCPVNVTTAIPLVAARMCTWPPSVPMAKWVPSGESATGSTAESRADSSANDAPSS